MSSIQFPKNNAYAWATSIEDIKVWILDSVNGSPVVGGFNWYNDMFSPDANGVVHIGGGVAGGHEWMISGYDRSTDLFLCTNSWSTSFGNNGQFFISGVDLQQLLNEQGDAVTAVEVSSQPAPNPGPTPVPSPAPSGCISAPLSVLDRMYHRIFG